MSGPLPRTKSPKSRSPPKDIFDIGGDGPERIVDLKFFEYVAVDPGRNDKADVPTSSSRVDSWKRTIIMSRFVLSSRFLNWECCSRVRALCHLLRRSIIL
jgi:hypothetical protein